jgi:hypothetical protein
MVTKAQREKLAAAVDRLAERLTPPERPEAWIVDGDTCTMRGQPDVVLTLAELDARDTPQVRWILVSPPPRDPSPATHRFAQRSIFFPAGQGGGH